MIVDPQSKGRIEIISRCPKCGEDFTRNFTPQNKQGWREVEEAARDHEKTCPNCSYYNITAAEDIQKLCMAYWRERCAL